jgi:hypothetical protein
MLVGTGAEVEGMYQLIASSFAFERQSQGFLDGKESFLVLDFV